MNRYERSTTSSTFTGRSRVSNYRQVWLVFAPTCLSITLSTLSSCSTTATLATVSLIAATIFPGPGIAITIADRYRSGSYVTITNAISLFDSSCTYYSSSIQQTNQRNFVFPPPKPTRIDQSGIDRCNVMCNERRKRENSYMYGKEKKRNCSFIST